MDIFDHMWYVFTFFTLWVVMNKGMRVGYIRVSTVDQNTDRQLDGLQLDKTFIDKSTGKNIDRTQYENMMNFVREGDRVIVHSMDRLARNLQHLRDTVKILTDKGVIVEFIKENLTFTGEDSAMSNLLLSIMGAFAEFEHSLIKERQREGIAIARAKGVYKGRSKCLDKEQIEQMKEWKERGLKITWIANQLKISRNSVYSYLKS